MPHKFRLIAVLFGLSLSALCSGCTSMLQYPPSPAGAWGPEVRRLGTVTADSGFWPLSLHAPPPDYTFYSALRAKAASTYGVAQDEIVVGEVTVKIGAEMDGTIRDWKGTAEVGQKKQTAASAKPPGDSLLELKKLLDAGAITPAEYQAKKKGLIDRL